MKEKKQFSLLYFTDGIAFFNIVLFVLSKGVFIRRRLTVIAVRCPGGIIEIIWLLVRAAG